MEGSILALILDRL